MSSFRFALIVVALFSTHIVLAQETIKPGCDSRSADVLQQCMDAMGGMSLVDVPNLKLTGSLSVKLQAGTEEYVVNGDLELVQVGYKSFSTLNREYSVFKMVTDGRNTWTSIDGKPFQEQTEMPNPPDWTPWPGNVMTWEEFNQIKFAGEEDIDGQPCWKLEFEHVGGKKSVRFFDKESGLPVQFRYSSTVAGENQTTFELVKHEDWMLPLRQTIKIVNPSGESKQKSEIEYEVKEIGFADEDAGFSIPPTESDK